MTHVLRMHQHGRHDHVEGGAVDVQQQQSAMTVLGSNPVSIGASSGSGKSRRSRTKRRSTAMYWGGGSSMKVKVRESKAQHHRLCKSVSSDSPPTDTSPKPKKVKKQKKAKAKRDEEKAVGKESGAEEEDSESRVEMKKKKAKKREKRERKEKKKSEKAEREREKAAKEDRKKEKKKEKKALKKQGQSLVVLPRAESEGSESGSGSTISSISTGSSVKRTKKKKSRSKSLIGSHKKGPKSRSPSEAGSPVGALPTATDSKARSFILNFHHYRHRSPLPPVPSSDHHDGPARSRSLTHETIERQATRKLSVDHARSSSIGGINPHQLLRRASPADGESAAAASPFFIDEDSGMTADNEAKVTIPLLALEKLGGRGEPPMDSASLPPSPSTPGSPLAAAVATAMTKSKSKRVKAWCKKKGLDKRRSGGLEQYQQMVMTMGVLDSDASSSTPLRHVIVEGRYAVGLP